MQVKYLLCKMYMLISAKVLVGVVCANLVISVSQGMQIFLKHKLLLLVHFRVFLFAGVKGRVR